MDRATERADTTGMSPSCGEAVGIVICTVRSWSAMVAQALRDFLGGKQGPGCTNAKGIQPYRRRGLLPPSWPGKMGDSPNEQGAKSTRRRPRWLSFLLLGLGLALL